MTTAPTNSPPVKTRTERIPPQDLDAERALLGSMMMSRDAIAEVIPIIGREDSAWFYLPAHQHLFEVLLDMYDDPTKAIDLIVVSDELRRRDLLESIGGQDYMILLADSFAEWANAEHYARIVRDKGMLRDLIRCAGEIAEEAYTGIDEAREILDVAEQRIFAVTEKRVGGGVIGIRDVMTQLMRQLDSSDSDTCTGLHTGFRQLDELLTGLQPGDLIIVAARPSMGKTALALTMAQHIVLQERMAVGFFSMEMSSAQLAQRLVSMQAGVDAHRVRQRRLSQEEIRQLLNACDAFSDAPLYVDDTPGMTAMELRSKARRLKQKADIQVIFIDYLQLMHSPRAESRQVEIAAISRGLKALGRELNIPIVAMAQLNRMPEGRQDKRPLMSDLRESGAIEQDADVVLLIHREEYYRPDDESVSGRADLIIAKQRNGPTGNVELQFNKKLTRFNNLDVSPVAYETGGDEVPF